MDLRTIVKPDPQGNITMTIRVATKRPKTLYRDTLADGTYRIDLRSVPEDGRANAELIAFLVEVFGVSTASVRLLSGHTSRRKVVRITLGA